MANPDEFTRWVANERLLRTSGIWAPTSPGTWQLLPATPLVEHLRVTLTSTSRAALCREYLVLAAGAVDAATQHRRLDALERLLALFLDPAQPRPAGLRRLPPPSWVIRENRRFADRLDRAADIAGRIVDLDGDVRGVAVALTTPRAEWRGNRERPRDTYARRVAPYLATMHLVLPFVVARMPEFAKRWPELAPAAIPTALLAEILIDDQPAVGGLLADDRWIFAALDAAERWRKLIIQRVPWLEPVLIEVRANWVE